MLYPCLRSYLFTRGTNKSKSFIFQQENLGDGLKSASSSVFNINAYYSILQPVFFGKLKYCNFVIEEPSVPKLFHYIIDYHAPKKTFPVHCPAYMHYKQSNWNKRKTLTNTSGKYYVVVGSLSALSL